MFKSRNYKHFYLRITKAMIGNTELVFDIHNSLFVIHIIIILICLNHVITNNLFMYVKSAD